MSKRFARTLVPSSAALLLALLGTGTAHAGVAPDQSGHRHTVAGHVYEATNSAAGNAIQVFDLTVAGALVPRGTVATGGLGTGVSLHSQDGVVRSGNLLFVVNGGDNTVSTLAITRDGLVLRDTEPSGGLRPVSVTARDGLVYVLNQASDTIDGFRVTRSGHLVALPGSARALTPNAAGGTSDAAEVAFSRGGGSVVVSQKATNVLDTFAVHGDYLSAATAHASAGVTPYGFDFDGRGHVVVSEAGSGSASSYRLAGTSLTTVSAAVPDTQAAACWLVVTADGRFAYNINAASATISSYSVAADGTLTLLSAVAASPGAGNAPTDAALTPDSRTLVVRLAGGVVASYAVASDGSLSSRGTAVGLAAFGTAGIATS